jgi:hypothetical protein
MGKIKIGEIYNKPIVIGDKNLVTRNEIHESELSGGTNQDTPSVSDEQVIKYYKINVNYNGVNYSDKWRELLVPFVARAENIGGYDASIRTCLYSGSISSNYGNNFHGIVTGSGGNLIPLYVSDAWHTKDSYSELSVDTLPFFLQNNTIDGIPNLVDCITEVSQKEFFNCAKY